jgi:hypothetical protein
MKKYFALSKTFGLTPRPPLRREADFTGTEWGGEGVEQRKEAGGLRPPASFKTSPLPRLDPLPQSTLGRGRGRGRSPRRAAPLGRRPERGGGR